MFKIGKLYRYTGGLTGSDLVVKVTALLADGKAKGDSVKNPRFGMTNMTPNKWELVND